MSVCISLLLIPLMVGANPKKAVDPAAELARASALEHLKAGHWADALRSAEQAVALAPQWSDAYFVRANALTRMAGARSEKDALKSAPALDADYSAMSEILERAANDLEQYLKLTPTARDRAMTLSAIAELRARAALARDALQRQAEAKRELEPVLEKLSAALSRATGVVGARSGWNGDGPWVDSRFSVTNVRHVGCDFYFDVEWKRLNKGPPPTADYTESIRVPLMSFEDATVIPPGSNNFRRSGSEVSVKVRVEREGEPAKESGWSFPADVGADELARAFREVGERCRQK